jgi:hypothetical protein
MLVQADNLAQIIESTTSIKLDVEQAAQTEMIGYLSQRYVTNRAFAGVTAYSDSVVYKGGNLVEYTEPTFSAATVYITGQRVVYSGNIYSSIAGSAAHAWNAAEWTFVVADLTLYYVTLPYPEFSYTTSYVAGDIIWMDDYTYTCITPCLGIVPTNTGFWGNKTAYALTAATKPTDATKWTLGDNRNRQLVMLLVDMTLYHLHSRINPRNIPDLRKERYDGNNPQQNGGAIAWLKRVAGGELTADLPNIVPQQGMSIRYNTITSVQTNTY